MRTSPRTIALVLWGIASSATADSINSMEAWKGAPASLAEARMPGAGFSFNYAGAAVGPVLSKEWQQVDVVAPGQDVTSTIYTHGSGLQITRVARAFPEFGAIEYKVVFKNTRKEVLSAISGVHALNLSFKTAAGSEQCVISSGGGLSDAVLPPQSFAIRRQCFAPTVPTIGIVELTTEGGRSSNKDLPFFFVQDEARNQGMFVAFGWSGQWDAMVMRDPVSGTLNVRARIPDLQIALEPGEQIEGPTALVGLYEGSLADGSNRLRRLIRDAYTPKLAGNQFLPISLYDTWFAVGVNFDEQRLKQLADGAAAIGQEYFLLDAGWYAGTGQGFDFSGGVGNWYEIDRRKLPGGLQPVADYARSKGLKFGLWFEPEVVAEGTELAKAHPEWILWKENNNKNTTWLEELYPNNSFFTRRYGLLDFGRPEVQQWVKELLDRYIRDYDIKYLRYDFNVDPLPYWQSNDRPGRLGVGQLRHIQGLYSVIDWIRTRHPQTILEGCASGGRRIDLETARRFHTFVISDHTRDPSIIRYHLSGINYFLPGNYHWTAYTLPMTHQQDFRADDLGFQSLFGGAFGVASRVDQWSEETKQKARLHTETWKTLRRYLVEDYYPLSAQPGDLTSWSGWQFHDPDDHSGFVQTFRTRTPEASHRFVLHGLDQRSRYRFTDAYGAEHFELDGAEAMAKGIAVTQGAMSSRVFTYRKVSHQQLSTGDGSGLRHAFQ